MSRRFLKYLRWIGLISLIAIFCHVISIVYPFLSGHLLISNDYMDIPEQTITENGFIKNPEFMKSINGNFKFDNGKYYQLLSMPETDSDDFITKNATEFSYQAHCGWIMHHHNSVLSPINEYNLGKNINKISSQYGYANIFVLSRLMELTGGVSLQNYLRVSYVFYPIFFLLYICISYVILKKLDYILIIALLYCSCLLELGFVQILLAPGLNPIRQISYLFVVVFLFLYLRKSSMTYLLLVMSSSLLSIFNNKEFGIISLAALIVTLSLRFINQRKFKLAEILIISGTLFFTVLFSNLGRYSSTTYYLLGISGPTLSSNISLIILLIIASFYILVLKAMKYNNETNYLTIFLFIYSQGILIYFIWNPSPNHFLSVTSPMILCVVLLMKTFMDYIRRDIKQITLITLVLGLSMAIYLPATLKYHTKRYEYMQIFENHKIYEWNLSRAQIRTTMDPKYFQESINLIEKYNKNKKIYMISKYDNILPFLAKKYSGMPFGEVATSLVTSKEIEESIKAILDDAPEYVFVDSDMDNTAVIENYPARLFMANIVSIESKLKMLRHLDTILNAIKPYYEPIETQYLITVYQKRK